MKRNRKWTAVVAAASLASVLLFGACSNGSDDDDTPAPQPKSLAEQLQDKRNEANKALQDAIDKAVQALINGITVSEKPINEQTTLGTSSDNDAYGNLGKGNEGSATDADAINTQSDGIAEQLATAIKKALSSEGVKKAVHEAIKDPKNADEIATKITGSEATTVKTAIETALDALAADSENSVITATGNTETTMTSDALKTALDNSKDSTGTFPAAVKTAVQTAVIDPLKKGGEQKTTDLVKAASDAVAAATGSSATDNLIQTAIQALDAVIKALTSS